MTVNPMTTRAAAARPLAPVRELPVLGTAVTPRVVAAWEARLGVDPQRRAEPTHFVGARGIHAWEGVVTITPRDAEQFRAVRYERELQTVASFCALHSPARVERTAAHIDADGQDLLLVTVTSMRGRTVLTQNGQEHDYSAGDLVFVATSSPFVQSASAITDPSGLAIPLDLLGRHRALAERPRRPINKRTSLSRAAAGFVRRFAADTALTDSPLPPEDTEAAAVDLVTAALSELTVDDAYRLKDDSLFNQQAALDLIAQRHRDPDFTPDTIAAELHLSRRQLYRLFENTEKSLASRIAEARIETAREMLVADPWLPVANIASAAGFRSVATFRNRFKAQFVVGPVEYRQRAIGS